MSANPKIRKTHLDRDAWVYVRQSTDHQVQFHLESQKRQYELADVAVRYGWPRERIQIVDEDQGRSGATTSGRAGFSRLVEGVALGKAGIVLGLEVSRLARNNSDWYQLLDLCSLTATLIGDSDGVYDPSAFNDRLLLGLKGTMSEAELHVLKGRMLAGLQHKAEQGLLRFPLPPGYEFDERSKIVKSSDERVAHLLDLLFTKVLEIGSVAGLLRYLQEAGLELPRRAPCDRTVRWVKPYYRGLYMLVTNPMYTGAYAFGRTRVVKELDRHGHARSRQRKQAMEDWGVLIHDHHAAYLSWEHYLKIKTMIGSNQPAVIDQQTRVLREGAALLQGLIRCGVCGRAMRVSYPGPRGQVRGNYACQGAWNTGGPRCISVGSRRIDDAVTAHVLAELGPLGMDVHVEALRRLKEKKDEVLAQLELDLERARYEAERRERQFNQVEPENRLVARNLEAQWNEALTHVTEIEKRVKARRSARADALSEIDERRLKELTQDLTLLFNSGTPQDQKRILRAVLDEVQITRKDQDAQVKILWKGGIAVTKPVSLIKVPKRPPSADAADLVRKLATRHTDTQIARVLSHHRIRTPGGQPFNSQSVANLRGRYGIPCYRATNDRDRNTCTVDEAAKRLEVHSHTIYLWIRQGLLKADQVTMGAPWSVYLDDDDVQRLTAADAPKGWLPLRQASLALGLSSQGVINQVKSGKLEFVYVSRGRVNGLRIRIPPATSDQQQPLF
ncbi:MAG: recombinase family protein [Gemmatimonadales bacterium]